MKLLKIAFFASLALIDLTYSGYASAPIDSSLIGPSVTIAFQSKTAQLTDASRATLRRLVHDSVARGKIDQIQIAAWSDNPAPREGEELSKADRDLAANRAQAIEHYLSKPLHVTKTDTYNMAERASWLAKVFDTSDADLKAEIGRGGDRSMSRDEFQIFKDRGQPSKAVVLVILKK